MQLNTPYKQIINVTDIEAYRNSFVLNHLGRIPKGATLLDIGAGLMPFKHACQQFGISYTSHDFDSYKGGGGFPGYLELNYKVPKHDIVCDITELENMNFQYALLTEVLEHVPDPVMALASALRTLQKSGVLLVTVPLRSHIHQAPHYYGAGFSPYFFIHHQRLGYEIISLEIIGDHLDYLAREVPKLVFVRGFWRIDFQHSLFRLITLMKKYLRNRISSEILTSGGFSTFAILRKT